MNCECCGSDLGFRIDFSSSVFDWYVSANSTVRGDISPLQRRVLKRHGYQAFADGNKRVWSIGVGGAIDAKAYKKKFKEVLAELVEKRPPTQVIHVSVNNGKYGAPDRKWVIK